MVRRVCLIQETLPEGCAEQTRHKQSRQTRHAFQHFHHKVYHHLLEDETFSWNLWFDLHTFISLRKQNAHLTPQSLCDSAEHIYITILLLKQYYRYQHGKVVKLLFQTEKAVKVMNHIHELSKVWS